MAQMIQTTQRQTCWFCKVEVSNSSPSSMTSLILGSSYCFQYEAEFLLLEPGLRSIRMQMVIANVHMSSLHPFLCALPVMVLDNECNCRVGLWLLKPE